jgi:FkbM family methyltransferase
MTLNIDDIFQQAFADHQNGQIEKAADGYKRVLSAESDHPSALHLLGLIELDLGNHEKAILLVERSLELAPNELQWLLNYGKLLSKMGKYELSISAYQKALSIDPDCLDARISLGDIYYGSGIYKEALKIYYRLLCENPDDATVRTKYESVMRTMDNGKQPPVNATEAGYSSGNDPIDRMLPLRQEKPDEDTEMAKVQAKQHEQGIGLSTGMSQRPAGKVDPVTEMGVMADAMYRMGYRESACAYAIQGLNAVLNVYKPRVVPGELLKAWQAPNIETMFVRMWLKLFMHSLYYATRKDAETVLKYWIRQEPQSAEPLIRLGLLCALHASKEGQPVPSDALETLLCADRMLNNERSAAALLLVKENFSNELVVPYDSAYLNVYPHIENLTTYVLLEQGDWFEDEIALFRDMIRPGDRILDLGANVGVYSISAARRTGSNGRIISVEPCRETFTLLSRSAAAFNNMTAIHAAVGEKSGRGYLEPGNQPELNRLQMSEESGEVVDVISVDELAEKEGVDRFDLIKIDVEGYEIPTIRGATKIIAESDPIILYEIKDGAKMNPELIDVFQELGYDSYSFRAPRGTLTRCHEGDQVDQSIINMFAVRQESLSRFKGLVNIE